MARKPRIEFEGAFYHVITRGNQRQRIFKDKADYSRYLEILTYYKSQHKFFLYAYVLMSNHVHLLIETRKVPLSKILQGINQSYTMHFNRRYRTVGHLFQGRYKAILCDKDEYLLALVKYIHLNPIRMKITKTPQDYQWSSYNHYIEKRRKDALVDTDQVLRMFSEDKAKARNLYRVYMNNGTPVSKDDIYCTVDQRVLGDERFVDTVTEHTGRSDLRGKGRHKFPLREIAEAVQQTFDITLRQIREKGKDRNVVRGRKVMSLVAREYGYMGKDIADYMKKDPAVITRYLKAYDLLEAEMKKVEETLKAKRIYVNKQV